MIGYKKTDVSKEEWLTPPELITALGKFDLDPCSPVNRPWPTAEKHYTILDDGLSKSWDGRVWCNPPYTRGVMGLWLERMGIHDNGISLIPARTDTDEFQELVFGKASSMLFLNGRLHFYHVNGKRAAHNSGGPSVLVAYGETNSESLESSGLQGRHTLINSTKVILVGFDKSWKWVLKIAMIRLNKAGIEKIYEEVERIAPEKIAKNRNYKAKIRQQLQRNFFNVQRGQWAMF